MNVLRVVVAALPVVFVCLPTFCHTFYLSNDALKFPMRFQLGSSCTSANEWIWITLVSVATLMSHIKVAKRIFARLRRPLGIRRIKRLSLLQINLIWWAISIFSPFFWNGGITTYTWVKWLDRIGAKAGRCEDGRNRHQLYLLIPPITHLQVGHHF